MVVEATDIRPRIPTDPPPPDQPPRVSIGPPSGQVRATVPTQITVSAFPGAHFVFSGNNQDPWRAVPIVTYTETEVDFDQASIRDHTGGGGVYSVTFATPGDHVVQA